MGLEKGYRYSASKGSMDAHPPNSSLDRRWSPAKGEGGVEGMRERVRSREKRVVRRRIVRAGLPGCSSIIVVVIVVSGGACVGSVVSVLLVGCVVW